MLHASGPYPLYRCMGCNATDYGVERMEHGTGCRVEAALKGAATPSEALSPATVAQPVDMVLHCPKCGLQHIDRPDEVDPHPTPEKDAAHWTNPSHKSHLCRTDDGGCGHIWRPADVPTNGVQAITTTGAADSPIAQPCASLRCGGAVAWNWLRGVVNGLPSIKSGYRHLIALHDVLAWIDEGERRAIASREQEPMGHVGPRTLELSIAELEEWLEHSNGEPMLPSEGESLSLVLHELKLMRAEKSREKFGCATCDGHGVVGGFVGGGYDSEPCPECYPPLPEPVAAMLPNGDRYAYTANQMRGYIDAYRAALSTAKSGGAK